MISTGGLTSHLTKALIDLGGHDNLSQRKKILIKGLSGALGAGFSAVSLFPLENIKIRKMVDKSKSESSKQGMMSTAATIYEEEGISGFFVGVVPYASYSIVSWGIFFLLYESIKYARF